MAHLLRARPRPHPARQRVPPPGRQDPGVRVPRRPPAHPPHPRARGRPGRHVGRRVRSASTSPSPRPSRSATTAVTARAATPARTRSRPYVDGGYDHAVWGADVTLDAAQPVPRDARRHPQPLVVPARAVDARGRGRSAGPTASPTCATTSRTPSPPASSASTCCPARVRERCGTRRSQQLGAFIARDDRRRRPRPGASA